MWFLRPDAVKCLLEIDNRFFDRIDWLFEDDGIKVGAEGLTDDSLMLRCYDKLLVTEIYEHPLKGSCSTGKEESLTFLSQAGTVRYRYTVNYHSATFLLDTSFTTYPVVVIWLSEWDWWHHRHQTLGTSLISIETYRSSVVRTAYRYMHNLPWEYTYWYAVYENVTPCCAFLRRPSNFSRK